MMLLAGRRRLAPWRLLLPLLALLLFSTTASAASAVLGIDIGNEYIKAALVKPGTPLEIVLTKDSRRKEAATLAFKPARSAASDTEVYPERLYGADAVALSARFPSDVFPNLKQLLGLDYDDATAAEYRNRYPGLVMEDAQGQIGFKSQSFEKEEDPFTVEELLAMELQNIQANAEAAAGKGYRVTDTVITIPSFYTAAEKRAVEFAADLAGMNVLALISDGLAVGLNYATGRTFPNINEGGKPEYHLVYDMGAGSVTATVLKFQGKTVKDVGKYNKTNQEVQVVGTAWDKSLGGDALNQLIVEDMVGKFVDRPRMKTMEVLPIHVKKHGKTMARLWKDAERLRQVLSANSETSASFEGLFYEDMNFQYKLSRSQFEKLAADYVSRVSAPLKEALESAQLSLSDLESVILHGGAVRTPFAQKELEATAGASKIRTNVNADEAAALGAGFKAAGISPSFRVKDIRAYDVPGFAVFYKWTSDGKERQQKLFTPTSQIGAEKQVPVKTLDDTTLEFYQTVDGQDVPVLEIKTTNLTASVAQLKEKHGCGPSNITTKFAIRLSPANGLPEIVQGTVSCETTVAEKGTVLDGVKGLFGFGSKKDGQEPLGEEEGSVEDLLMEDATTASTETSTSTTPASVETSAAAKDSKPRTIVIPVHFTSLPLGRSTPPSPETLSKIKARLAAFDKSDQSRKLRSEALNTLEAFTYRARDYLSDEEFVSFSSEAIRQTLEERLSSISDWLYSDGLDASLNEYKAKLSELKTLVEPVLKRRDEGGKRETAIENLQQQLESTKNMIQIVRDQIEKAASESASAASLTRTPETASPFTTLPSESATASSSDVDDDLDADPYSTTTSVSTIPSSSPSSVPVISPYTEADLSSLSLAYDSISTWLEHKLAAQAKLKPTEDPAILVSDIESKAKKLQDELSAMVRRKIQMPPKSKTSASSKSKSKKAKKSTSSKTDEPTIIDEDVTITSTVTEPETTETVSAKQAKKGKGKGKDEL